VRSSGIEIPRFDLIFCIAYKYYLDSVVFMRRITIFSYIIEGEGRAVSVAKLFVRYYYKSII